MLTTAEIYRVWGGHKFFRGLSQPQWGLTITQPHRQTPAVFFTFLTMLSVTFVNPRLGVVAEMLQKELLFDIKIYFYSIKINFYSRK